MSDDPSTFDAEKEIKECQTQIQAITAQLTAAIAKLDKLPEGPAADSLEKTIKEMRAELADLRTQLSEAREELKTLKATPQSPPPPPPPPKKGGSDDPPAPGTKTLSGLEWIEPKTRARKQSA